MGLQTAKRVPEALVPVIGAVAQLRREGVPDQEIERRLKEASSGGGWPEEVLARLQAAATVPARKAEEELSPASPAAPCEFVRDLSARALYRSVPDMPLVAADTPASASDIPELAVRNMVTGLRMEICAHAVEERELLHRMNQLLQDLILEVRDLRWAIILSSSRKERKRGRRTITKLLSG